MRSPSAGTRPLCDPSQKWFLNFITLPVKCTLINIPTFPRYPRVSRRQFRQWNENMFIRYNNERVYHHPNPLIRYIENSRVKSLLTLLSPIRRTDIILAAGCGEGYIEKYLHCKELYMVDISKEAIKRAKQHTYPAQKTHFYTHNLEKLPFSSAKFDKIECSEVIEHVYSPQHLLVELSRVLKPTGNLVISFPNEPLINAVKKIFIHLRIFNLFFPNIPKNMVQEWHLHAFTLSKFRQFSRQKLIISKVVSVPFFFFPVRYVIQCHKPAKD